MSHQRLARHSRFEPGLGSGERIRWEAVSATFLLRINPAAFLLLVRVQVLILTLIPITRNSCLRYPRLVAQESWKGLRKYLVK
jgi:hypothetical protein